METHRTAGNHCRWPHTHVAADLGRFYGYNAATDTTTLLHDQSFDWDSFVGSLRAIYHIDPHWSVYGGISQSFRAPNLNDLSGDVTSLADTKARGSLDAQPERYLTYEIGVRQESPNFSSNAAFFYTDVTDGLTSVKDGTRSITTNAAEGYVYGAELEAAWRINPQWSLSGYVAWMDARTKAPEVLGGSTIDKPNSRQMPLTDSLALRWTDSSRKYWVEGRILAANDENRITAADQAADYQRIPTNGTPGYVVASLHAGWKVNDHLDLTCGIENLTNQDYRNHGSGQNDPGINGIFGANVTW